MFLNPESRTVFHSCCRSASVPWVQTRPSALFLLQLLMSVYIDALDSVWVETTIKLCSVISSYISQLMALKLVNFQLEICLQQLFC